MKKLIILLLIATVFFACDKTEEPTTTAPSNTVNPIILKKWKQYIRYDNGVENTSGDMSYWDFKSDLTIKRDYFYADTTILPNVSYTETWSLANNDSELRVLLDRWVPINGGTDSMHIDGYEIYEVLNLSSDTLIIQEDRSDETLQWIMKIVFIPN